MSPWTASWQRMPALLHEPALRSSTRTSWPASTIAFATFARTNPVAPVTRIFTRSPSRNIPVAARLGPILLERVRPKPDPSVGVGTREPAFSGESRVNPREVWTWISRSACASAPRRSERSSSSSSASVALRSSSTSAPPRSRLWALPPDSDSGSRSQSRLSGTSREATSIPPSPSGSLSPGGSRAATSFRTGSPSSSVDSAPCS